MKSRKIYLTGLFAGLVTIVIIISCDRSLDIKNPNTVTSDNFYRNTAELQAGTNAIYAAFHGSNLVGREWFFLHDTRSDEVATGGSQLEVPRFQLLTGVHDPNNSVMVGNWDALYTMIFRANVVILQATKLNDNPAAIQQCVLQAKFLRAWAYFELVTQWGPVPIYKVPVTAPDQYQARAPEADVYALIVSDLNDAAAGLPAKGGTENGRATKDAANFLLGRVLMQKGDYAGAKTALLKITGYSLTARYLDNFEEEKEFNNESIFEVVFNGLQDNYNWGGNGIGDGSGVPQTTVRNQEYCPVAWRNLVPSNKYLDEFEDPTAGLGATKMDPRYKFSVYESGDFFNDSPPQNDPAHFPGSQDKDTLTDPDQNNATSIVHGVTKKVSWRKYMLIYKQTKAFAAGTHPGGNNQRIFRYADVLLMLAECENETSGAGAVGYLNQVRDRADVAMPHYPNAQFPTGSKDQITRAIMHERMVELGDEEVRNIDIMRWRRKGYYPAVVPEPISYFQANKHELLPIPQGEIDNNPALGAGGISKQNPGY